MFTLSKGRPLVTTTTGALPRPKWFTANLHGRPFSVAMGDPEFREQYADAVSAFLSDQHRAGLDIMVDGDARFDIDIAGHSWFRYVSERLEGMGGLSMAHQRLVSTRDKKPGDILYEVMETRLPGRVVGPIGRGNLEYARMWKAAQRLTPKPLKFGAISGQLVETVVKNEFYKDRHQLVMDISAALNQEYHDLADAGCPLIQIEVPCIHEVIGIVEDSELSPEFYVEAFNAEVSGLRSKTEVWCHACWGSPAAQRVEHQRQSYRAALPYFDRLDVDVLTFEAASDGGADLAEIGRTISSDKKICIGVVSHRTLQVERPEEVAALIRKALEHVALERLILSTDCGFGRQGMSRLHAFHKMVSIVRGANIVRRELGLDEVEVPATDERFALLG